MSPGGVHGDVPPNLEAKIEGLDEAEEAEAGFLPERMGFHERAGDELGTASLDLSGDLPHVKLNLVTHGYLF